MSIARIFDGGKRQLTRLRERIIIIATRLRDSHDIWLRIIVSLGVVIMLTQLLLMGWLFWGLEPRLSEINILLTQGQLRKDHDIVSALSDELEALNNKKRDIENYYDVRQSDPALDSVLFGLIDTAAGIVDILGYEYNNGSGEFLLRCKSDTEEQAAAFSESLKESGRFIQPTYSGKPGFQNGYDFTVTCFLKGGVG